MIFCDPPLRIPGEIQGRSLRHRPVTANRVPVESPRIDPARVTLNSLRHGSWVKSRDAIYGG
jgi:hypothetical protein